MGHLLKRSYFISEFNIVKKLWRKQRPLSLNHSLPLFNQFYQKTSRELNFMQARTHGTFLNSIQCSTRRLFQMFPHLRGYKSLSTKSSSSPTSRCSQINQFKHDNDNCHPKKVTFSVSAATFSDHVDVLTVGNDIINTDHSSDHRLKAQIYCFRQKLQNCTSVNKVLSLADDAMKTKSLHVDCFSVLFAAYQDNVYKMLTFPWLVPELYLKREQLKMNFLFDQVMEPYTTDTRFKNLMAYAEMLVGDISYGDCVHILNSLHYLFDNNSSFASKIIDKCTDNLNKFNLNQLAIFSSSLHNGGSDHNDTYLLGKIVDAAKRWLTAHSTTTQDIDLGDMCDVFINTRHLVSTEMWELGAEIINSKLASDPSNVTLDMISKASIFGKIANNECEESLVNGLLNLPPQCFSSFDVTSASLTFAMSPSIGRIQWLDPIFKKLRAHCLSELNTSKCLTIQEMVTYALLLKRNAFLITDDKRKLFAQLVNESDNYLLYQLMSCHSEESWNQLPELKEILCAYHKRMTRLFASLNQTQQEKLIWGNHHHFGKYLYIIFDKFKEFDILPNLNLQRTLASHIKLQSNDWDAPLMKIIVAAKYALKRLKSNCPLAPCDLSALIKFLPRLNFNDLIDIQMDLDFVLLKLYISSSVKQQSLELMKTIHESFQTKLSGINTLAPYFVSRNILPYIKKSTPWKIVGGDLFSQLMDSLPRLLKSEDEKNYLRILSLLYLSSEKFPVYQKETFEKLISFVTSSPKLLIFSGIHLVKILAYNGHQPDNLESFATWSQLLITQVMEHMFISKSMLIKLAYYLSLLGIFHDKLLLKIFSLEFMETLAEELNEVNLLVAEKINHEFALLNRSVSIECPHLAVPWFSGSLLKEPESSSTINLSRLIKSINRLTRPTNCVVTSTESPYGHNIDALMYFDPRSGIVKCDDVQVQNSQPLPDVEKIALLKLQSYHLCYNCDNFTGKFQADIRQLQILGYTVVLFTKKELSSMNVNVDKSLDNFVRTRINDATGSQVFKDFEE